MDDKKPVLELVNSAKKPPPKKSDNMGGNGGGKGSKNPVRFDDYAIINDAFHQIKVVKDGEGGFKTVEIPLCNFTCHIVEEIIADDGLADTNFLRIEGKRSDGKLLPIIDVPIKSFYSSQANWVNEHWGTVPFINPGAAKKDNIRAAIQLYSCLNGDIPRRTIYKYIGWKKINGHWHYLTGAGSLTADGLISGAEVELGGGHMSRYQLTAPLKGDALRQAVNDTLALFSLCPSKPYVGVALFAAVARAPLGECHPTDFAIWLHGLTGSRKSAVAAIAQGFFGSFTARSFPANWSDSVNDCEMKSHQAKDAVFVVDDFKPSISQSEAAKLHAMAERLIRNTGNQAGRGRRGADMQAKAAPYNRSMMIVTAEDLPRGQSLLGRLLILELTRADVDNAVLTRLQSATEAGRFMGVLSAYLQWLAPRLDELKKTFPKNVEAFRNAAIRDGLATSHPRAPEIYANLVAGAELFLAFLETVGGVTSQSGNECLLTVESHLQQAFSEQGAYLTEQDEVERFLQLLRAVFSSGNAHVLCRLKQREPTLRPYGWGWRNTGESPLGDKAFTPMGDSIGWYCDPTGNAPAELWLQQEAAFKVVQQFARNQGDSFLLSPASLWRRMHERSLILKTEPDGKNKPRLTVKRTIAGRNVRVMVLSAELVESGE